MRKITLLEAAPILKETSEIKGAILVGGQAIAFWSQYYNIEQNIPAITKDIDFYGGSECIELAESALKKLNPKSFYPGLDDSTSNSGKVVCDLDYQSKEKVGIDFLYNLTGLSDDEIEDTACEIDFFNKKINVLHPLLCMQSKIINLAVHIGKRNEEGVEQARLSVEIVKAYLSSLLIDSPERIHKICEKIFKFSMRESSLYSNYQFKVDSLKSIPIECLPESEFRDKRYPQAESQINEKRKAFNARMDKKINQFGEDLSSERFRP